MKNVKYIKENMQRYEIYLAPYATFSKDAIRCEKESSDIRTEFERDIDKIIHSPAYTRYIDKTQVYSNLENDNVSRRMTHIQFVSRAAKTIARALKLNEDLCEAIALGHDIGHVPYGHEGEYILNDISKKVLNEVFAHNVQSVRNLMQLENGGRGLNLTVQVLDGIMCHNGELLQDKYLPITKTFEDFNVQYQSCYTDDSVIKKLIPMTMEGCVVRISDIIGYIGKDIEDAIRLKMLKKEDIPHDIIKVLGITNREIMNTIICDIIENSFDKNYICMSKIVFEKIQELKKFNYENIYHKALSDDNRIELKQKFETLYNIYYNAIIKQDKSNVIWKDFINSMNNKYIKENKAERIAIDFIAGMTDNYFEREYNKYSKDKN